MFPLYLLLHLPDSRGLIEPQILFAFSDRLLCCGTNCCSRRRDQEVCVVDGPVRVSSTLQCGGAHALERAVGPSCRRVPGVARRRDCADQAHLGAGTVDGCDVARHGRGRAAHHEAGIAVVPGRIAGECEGAGVAIINETLLRIGESDTVLDDVVGRRVVGDAQLETVAVACEVTETPTIETVAPGVDLVNGDRRGKHIQVESIIHVVPESCIAEDVAFARSFFTGEAVSTFAILARVPVAVRVEVDDRVVRRRPLDLESRLVVVVG